MFPFGNVARPGPGFYPVGVGIFLCLAAGALVLGAARGAPVGAGTPGRGPAADARARVIVTAAGLVGFCLLLPWIGYPVCAFLFVALLLRRLGGTRWPGVVVTAAVSAFLSHYVFAVLAGRAAARRAVLDRAWGHSTAWPTASASR